MKPECTNSPEPLTLDAKQAAELIGVSRSTFLRMDATGLIGPQSVRLLRRRVWLRSELIAWVNEARCCSRIEWIQRQKVKGK